MAAWVEWAAWVAWVAWISNTRASTLNNTARWRPARCRAGCFSGTLRLPHDLRLSSRLRRVLHRAVDRDAVPRHAERQTRRRALRASRCRQPVPAVRSSRSPAVLRRPEGPSVDVRHHRRRGDGDPHALGTRHLTLTADASTAP